MAFRLYEDQAEFVDKLRESLKKGNKSILGVAMPAFGKTVVAASITKSTRERDPQASVWFLVHRKNLLRQTSKSFWKDKIEHGLLTGGKTRSKMPIQVGTIGTVHSRLAVLKPPKILFVDEAHLARGRMFTTVIEWALAAGSIVIGLTGTPIRLDGKSLGDVFEDLIEAKSAEWLMQQGRICRYNAYSVPITADLSEVKNQAGDYNKTQLADAMDKPTITGNAVTEWKRHASGLRTVCYCVNVKHSQHTAQAFNDEGIKAAHVDASTTEAELKAICEGLASREIKVLCNCELVIEGFDLSSQVGYDVTLECCILLRPTQSLARYLQMVFRALRMKPNKAVILDNAGCIIKHGLPCEKREWSLEGEQSSKRKKKKDDEPDINVSQCLKCYHVFRPDGRGSCPKCGEAIEIKERKIETVEGELEEIDIEAVRRQRKQEQGSARDLHDLVAMGIRKGMRSPHGWAANVYASRAKRKATKDDFNNAKRVYNELRN
jgi:DNA repair protein RadD